MKEFIQVFIAVKNKETAKKLCSTIVTANLRNPGNFSHACTEWL
jgi:hypothetical protein